MSAKPWKGQALGGTYYKVRWTWEHKNWILRVSSGDRLPVQARRRISSVAMGEEGGRKRQGFDLSRLLGYLWWFTSHYVAGVREQ